MFFICWRQNSFIIMNADDASWNPVDETFVLSVIRAVCAWFFPHSVRFFPLRWCGPTTLKIK